MWRNWQDFRGGELTIVVRGRSVSASMSDYLIRELDAIANVSIRAATEVTAAHGVASLERLTLRDRPSGTEEIVEAAALFVMIGAEPRTDWLPPEMARDPSGYLLTGDDVPRDPSRERPPLFLETNLAGVFAVGDVRHGATRRVAPSVGAGAIAISLVHQYLAERPLGG